MGWTNSPPIFSTAAETIADLANARLQQLDHTLPPHHLDDLANTIPLAPPSPPTDMSRLPPVSRDPSLPHSTTPLAYTDVFVDDFVAAAQELLAAPTTNNRQQVRRILLHNVGNQFQSRSSVPVIAHGAQ